MSRGGRGKRDETCGGNIVRAEHVRGIGRTDEDNISLSERRRSGLEMWGVSEEIGSGR